MATTSTAGLSHTLPPLSHLDFLQSTSTSRSPTDQLDVTVTSTPTPDTHDRDSSNTPDTLTIPDAMSTLASPIVPESHTSGHGYSPSPSTVASSSSIGHGAKRTISGNYKQPEGRESAPLTGERKDVGQLSSQLKDRLALALLKVRNNWTNSPLSELETRISDSPRFRLKREPSSSTSSAPSTLNADPQIKQHIRTSCDPSSQVDSQGRPTYESFWREHEHNPITKKIWGSGVGVKTPSVQQQQPYHPSDRHQNYHQANSLAPPTSNRRSLYNPHRHIPSLHHGSSTQSNASAHSLLAPPPSQTQPTTPGSSQQSSSQAPTQRTMEQDAVESLMFLSSPGHSQQPSQQQRQQLPTPQSSQQSSQSKPRSPPSSSSHHLQVPPSSQDQAVALQAAAVAALGTDASPRRKQAPGTWPKSARETGEGIMSPERRRSLKRVFDGEGGGVEGMEEGERGVKIRRRESGEGERIADADGEGRV